MSQDYNKTLNLPKTDFPMRAGLPQREPAMLEKWENERLYEKMMEHNEGKPVFAFHDGPPYANADIHLGTALNKVLKDIIVRYKNMNGFKTHYVPGWDTHGLPIELKAIKAAGVQITNDPVKLRQHCKEFALYHVENQKKQFKRLGTMADYDHPYLTLDPKFEATQIEVFGAMAKKNYIYKDLKSVYWCPECVTALAEAEIEYADDPCDSIYVKFQVTDDKGVLTKMGAKDLSKTYVVIWTTTTWTLPANLATCLGPEFEYVVVQADDEYYVMAKELVDSVMKAAGISDYTVLGSALGKELEYIQYSHPFLDRISPVILGDHVTLESGTGCVHTAPGHGVEDFDVCARFYPEVGVVVPVDAHGVLTEEAGQFAGLTTKQANKAILEHLKETGHLLAVSHIVHQYPHCWRCKEPILFRATEQWFCNVEDFKDETIKAIEGVQFIPEWGRDRMTNMVVDRNAWCISRQRVWGVPIPVFYCDDCGEYIVTDETIKVVSDLFREEGSDAWFIKDAAEILPKGFSCPHCGSSKGFTKEKDIMDVWFDSGVSHAAVLERWPDQQWPCDLYLEGTDQYRGWFQSSLLTSVAWRGQAPYKAVCTHGWVVDGEGRKMSKSLGNGVVPEDIIKDFGADILRLWVASSDYHADIRISKDILKQLSEIYRKIRNTARYILGNLDGFNPDTDCVADDQLLELDRWALARMDNLLQKAKTAYDRFDFHIIFHAIHNFCTIDMSNFYLDVIKDRLYIEATDGVLRRSAQTAIYKILRALDLLVSPIIPFTAEEIWGFMPASKEYDADSVTFNTIPDSIGPKASEDFMAKWDTLIALRDEVNKALEIARADKVIGKSLEAKVVLTAGAEQYEAFSASFEMLPMLFIVSQVELLKGEGDLAVLVEKAEGEKCERCWTFDKTVGEHAEHPTLCSRCADIV
ncbi:isoleucine--tRNA ligase [Oscillospiraceae bacterium MB08-C2-2]|nr:isoleucine--tRNA ligase [Oscillospiraceae bacterium MB08-C2-2]